VGGSILGEASDTGAVFGSGNLGPVTIGGNLQGNGFDSGSIDISGDLASLTIGGSIIGGSEEFSGTVFCRNLGSVKITGNIQGGSGDRAGAISTLGDIASLTIGGSLIGGSEDFSGSILTGKIGALKIDGDLVGGSAEGAAILESSGFIRADRIASVFVGGSIIADTDLTTGAFEQNGAIQVFNDIGPITIKGSLVGNSTNPVVISARGQKVVAPVATTDVTIASLTVGSRVEFANILAGYDVDLRGQNADAQIGAVTVGGDWIASNLVAGVDAGTDKRFGTADDVLIAEVGDDPNIKAKIASVTIGGQALGTPVAGDHFGFVAQTIGALSVGGTLLPLTAAVDVLSVGATGDLNAREVG